MSILSPSELQPTWHRVSGVELLGPATGSGLTQATCLVQRQDGQVIQLSELLNLVVATAEPALPAQELARRVSAAYGRELTPEGLDHLIDTKLRPLGLIENDAEVASASASASTPPLPTADPLLALRLRGTIVPKPAVRRIAAVLSPVYLPGIVITVLVGFVLLDIALLLTGDALAALDQVLVRPVELLILFGLLTLGALIHELGHATACHYGGARPGVIGFGLYLVFPAFFTNVTDSYRLGRVGRLRTDLGGLYFNVWCVLAAGLGYLVTGNGVLLLVVIIMQLQMLQQLPPTIRLDGYFILADLAGVPDLFSRVGPVVRSLMPGRGPDPRVSELRPAARRIVTIWVVTVIPLLILALVWTLWSLPVIVDRIALAIGLHAQVLTAAVQQGQPAEAILAVLSIVFLALPLVGLVAVILHLARSAVRLAAPRIQRMRARRRENTADTVHTETAASDGRTPAMSAIKPLPVTPLRQTALTSVPAPIVDEATAANHAARASFLIEDDREAAASEGWRGTVVRTTRIQVPASAAELHRRRLTEDVSRQWPGARKVAVVNGKGGVGKTITTAMLAAVFARNGGGGVLAWDNNDTRGTLGWRTEKSAHDATVHDLLPATARLLSPSARISDLARFVHHQTSDKYDVLRSNPELLASRQRIEQQDFDALHEVATKYYRMVLFDSGNDESAARWLRMIDVTDQIVVVTPALGEPAESGALLLEALLDRDEESANLSRNAVVVVLQSERSGTLAEARRIADGFADLARAAVIVPFDLALHGGALRYDALKPATRNAWLDAAAAIANGLD